MSIYGFDIPHDKGTPCRDYVAIQIPYPPSKVGSILVPDIVREINSSAVQAGIIRQLGPLAFWNRIAGENIRQEAEIGDWVLIRWGAGTWFAAGKGIVNSVGGWRYLSSFNDIIKIYKAEDMPDPATLEWTDQGIEWPTAAQQPEFNFDRNMGVRERHVYGANNAG